LNLDGTISKHKARPVARGFMQRYVVDYNEVFAPVARLETVRLVVELASSKKYIGELLERFDMTYCNTITNSSETNAKLDECSSEEKVEATEFK
jgi:hypothetical protein